MDAALLIAQVASFATLLGAHLALAVGLLFRDPWWRGLLALVVPPLSPWFGFKERFRFRTALWALSLVCYGATWAGSGVVR